MRKTNEVHVVVYLQQSLSVVTWINYDGYFSEEVLFLLLLFSFSSNLKLTIREKSNFDKVMKVKDLMRTNQLLSNISFRHEKTYESLTCLKFLHIDFFLL